MLTSYEVVWTAHVTVVVVHRQVHAILGSLPLRRVLRIRAVVDEIATQLGGIRGTRGITVLGCFVRCAFVVARVAAREHSFQFEEARDGGVRAAALVLVLSVGVVANLFPT